MDTNDIVTTCVTIALFLFNFICERWNQYNNAKDLKEINLKTDYYRDEQIKNLQDMAKSLNLLPERLGFYLQLINDNLPIKNYGGKSEPKAFNLNNRNNNEEKTPKSEQVKSLVGDMPT